MDHTRPERASRGNSKRRWLRYSLSTLLLMMTACAMIFGLWFRTLERQARRQASAAKAIEELDGLLFFDYQLSSGTLDRTTTPTGPAWLRRMIGEDYFRRAEIIDLAFKSGFPIWPSKITDQDLIHLESLPHLHTVEIGRNPLTDKGLAHLQGLSKLKTLYLNSTLITGTGCQHLRQLPRFEWLVLSNSPVTDQGLRQVGKLSGLKHLSLERAQITDEGLKALVDLKQLDELRLAYTSVGDAGLRHLAKMSKLTSLDLTGTEVTPAGVAEFKNKVPGCRVALSYGFGEEARDIELWPPGTVPTREQLVAHAKKLGGVSAEVRVDETRSGNPINVWTISYSDASDETVIRVLEQMPDLEHVFFSRVLFGDGVLEAMTQLTKLSTLETQMSRITDAGVVYLSEMSQIKVLGLRGSRITDSSVEILAQLTNLNRLDVAKTRISIEGAQRLRAALPNCQIIY